jgi:acetate kinase
VAPAHNPPYIAAMRLLSQRFPQIPLVAAFETGFHATLPDAQRYYAVPFAWADEIPVRRWGFHGASHRYIAVRTAELLGSERLRIISCHLGGSSSVCAIRSGQSVANSLDILAKQSGLLGLSGVSGDLRDIDEAACQGNVRARIALEVFAASVRHYLGAYLVELDGADVIVFTGGIGENQPSFRQRVCGGLEELGIVLDAAQNALVRGSEARISAPESRVQIWTVPTNEELIVARQAKQLLSEAE